MNAGAVIVAAGSGTRMGRPKQFLPMGGRGVCEWALKAFLDTPEIRHVVMVLSGENVAAYGAALRGEGVTVVEGGETRMGSVANGFNALPKGLDLIAIHDGARPLVTPEIIRRTLAEAEASGASVAAVRAKDTLKRSDAGGWVVATPERSEHWQAQTPQCYRREVLSQALEQFAGETEATDESQLVERAGHRVKLVEASYENIKITTPEDLIVARTLMEGRMGTGAPRTGFGYDIHRLVAGRPLKLAGIAVEHDKGLEGHSDGDVVLHAASDAVLGALGEGEIGIAFPPTNPEFKGIDSRKIAGHVMERAGERGARIVNIDITLVAEEPKLKPHYEAMRASLAGIFGADIKQVNLKAKSQEGLGEIGRGEAIACYAVVSLLAG